MRACSPVARRLTGGNRRVHRRLLFEHATWSIHRVLARHIGEEVEPDVWGETDLRYDPVRTDVKALVASGARCWTT